MSLHVAVPWHADAAVVMLSRISHALLRARVPHPVEELKDMLKELGHDEL